MDCSSCRGCCPARGEEGLNRGFFERLRLPQAAPREARSAAALKREFVEVPRLPTGNFERRSLRGRPAGGLELRGSLEPLIFRAAAATAGQRGCLKSQAAAGLNRGVPFRGGRGNS